MTTTEASSAQTQLHADTAMLPWGPRQTCSALPMGFVFQCIDVGLNGDTIFIIPAAFSSFPVYPPATDSSEVKILIYFHTQSFLCTYETEFLWKRKKAAC